MQETHSPCDNENQELFQHYSLKLRMQHLTCANTSTSTWSHLFFSKRRMLLFLMSFFLFFIYDFWNCRISKSNLCMCHMSNTRQQISQHQFIVKANTTTDLWQKKTWDDDSKLGKQFVDNGQQELKHGCNAG